MPLILCAIGLRENNQAELKLSSGPLTFQWDVSCYL